MISYVAIKSIANMLEVDKLTLYSRICCLS